MNTRKKNDSDINFHLKSNPLPGKTQTWLLSMLFVLSALTYFNSLFNGLTSYDDYQYLQKNNYLRNDSWEGVKAIFTSFYASNYHPLTTLTYLFEYSIWGLNPFPYHFTNLALHLINIFLVFKVSLRLSNSWITAYVVCSLFALTPMHVESVAWVSERKDVLYAVFYLLSILQYLKYINSGSRFTMHYFSTLLFFLLSLFSKSAAVTLPVLLIAIDLYKNRRVDVRTLTEKIPFFALSVLFGMLNIYAQQNALTDMDTTYNLANRFFLLCGSVSFYIVKLILPINLSLVHFFPGTENGFLPWYFYASFPFLAILMWLILRWKKYHKESLFGFAFFFITISVMLQLIPVGSAYASERYSYISYIGLFYIVGQWVSDNIEKSKKILVPVFFTTLLIFSIMTWQRISIWKNDDTLFGDIRRKDPLHAERISRTIAMVGNDKKLSGDLEGALDDYSQAILFDPNFGDPYFFRAMVNNDLGNLREAINDYNAAIARNVRPPLIFHYRGVAYHRNGIADSAISDYTHALSMEPASSRVLHLRGLAFLQINDTVSACSDFQEASRLGDTASISLARQYCK